MRLFIGLVLCCGVLHGKSYSQLPITAKDAETIYVIVDTLSSHNVLMLGLKKWELEEKGESVSHVHPLRFLAAIFSNPHLKGCMREVRTSSFKWDGFMGPLGKRLDKELRQGELVPYLPEFSSAVGADPKKVETYAQAKDWNGLVEYLMKID